MHTILLKTAITPHQLDTLHTEFPHFSIITEPQEIEPKRDQIEIIYGDTLSLDELQSTHHLRWVHIPSPSTRNICLEALKDERHLLISTTTDDHLRHIGEFSIGVILSFAKNVFAWKEQFQGPESDCKEELLSSMWSATNKTLVQIGLGGVGTEIAKRSKMAGFRVFGVQDPPSFHPYADKTFPTKDLHSILPSADVVCVSLPREQPPAFCMKKEQFDLLKQDAIFLAFGNGKTVSIPDLEAYAKKGTARGIVIDAHFSPSIPSSSPLWTLPNVLITPAASSYPKLESNRAFQTFLYNLRQFLHGNYSEMQNLVRWTLTN